MSFESNAIYFARRAAEERAMMLRSTSSMSREAHRKLAELYAAAANLNDNPVIHLRTGGMPPPSSHEMPHLS